MKKIILLFGPTASGKSRLAIDLAQNYNGEIVNADSMQVYSEIKILSARPNEKPLHLCIAHLRFAGWRLLARGSLQTPHTALAVLG